MKFFLLLLVTITFFSCVEDEFESHEMLNIEEKMEFYYQGKFYSSSYEFKGSDIIIKDSNVMTVYNNIISNKNHVKYIKDNTTTYFKNISDFLKNQNINEAEYSKNKIIIDSNTQLSLSQKDLGINPNNHYFGIFEDANYGGQWWYMNGFNGGQSTHTYDIPNLGNLQMGIPPYVSTINLNDEVTSFRFTVPLDEILNGNWFAIFYRDINFGGPALVIGLQYQHNIPNIGNPYNDEISSIVLLYNYINWP